ncbi:MAG: hypothetical protein AUJ25_00070 [Parcubacteria group bacterium CG1_02_37_13]|nr:MAG: hypothetical protein AUJ25_00070 [Parcubacteria group bacterium CG1_02_37_13]
MPQPQVLTEGVVFSDRYDKRAFTTIKGKASRLLELEQKGIAKVKSYSPLLQDLYSALYKADPWLKPKEQVRASEQVNRGLVQKVMDTKQYPELRGYTYLDEFASAMAVLTLGEVVLLILEDVKKELNDIKEKEDNELQGLSNQAQAAGEEADEGQGEADELAQAAMQAQANGSPQASQLKSQAGQAQSQADQLANKAEQAQMTFEQAQERLQAQGEALSEQLENEAGEKIRQAIRKASKEALDKTEEAKETMEAWGIEPGEIQNLSFEEKMELANKLHQDKKLREIAKLVGRFRRMALAKQKEKTKSRTGIVTNIKCGNDLRRLVPSERAKLSHPIMKMDFLRRLAGRQLFVFETKEKESLGQGPVIVCIDNSGSIQAGQEIWEKALAIGLYQAADYQKRHFIFIQYGGPDDPLALVEIRQGEASHKKLLEVARYFLGGGTDFEKPLKRAKEYIEKGLKADIVFITDGQCAVSQDFLMDFNQARKEVLFNVYSVLLTKGGGSVSTAAVERFSDEVFEIEDLTCEAAGEIFAKV